MPTPDTMQMRDADGRAVDVPIADVANALEQGLTVETAGQRYERIAKEAHEDQYGGIEGAAIAGGTAALGAFTLGGSDAAIAALGGGEKLRAYREAHPIASVVGTVAGSLPSAGAIGRIGGAARNTFEVAKDAGLVAKVGSGIAAGAVEGTAMGLQQGISDVAMSDEPLNVEHALSSLHSSMLYGGALGAVAGGATKMLGRGLERAKAVLDDHIAASSRAGAIGEDLITLDAKGLRAARDAELAALEEARVPQRSQIADDIRGLRQDLRAQKLWLATKDSTDAEVRVIGKQTLKADRQLDNLLDNPKALATNPQSALSALQKQEHALEQLAKKSDGIRATVAAERAEAASTQGVAVDALPPSARITALDQVAPALEQNRALQQRIADITAPHASPRLSAIADAVDTLAERGSKQPLAQQLLGGSIFGSTASAVGSIPVLGQIPGVAQLAGAKAAEIGKLLFGRLGNATTAAAERTSKALGTFLSVAEKAPRVAPVLATRVLASVRYASEDPQDRRRRERDEARAIAAGQPVPEPKLAALFKARADELRSQVDHDETGTLRMRTDARRGVADRLSPIRAIAPMLADKLEEGAARRVEFLASKLPTQPHLAALPTGPDTWKPSDFAMRQFARYAAAVEDPGAVEERLSDGSITPEDVEAYKAVYPERYAEMTIRIAQGLPTLRAKLPFARRLALSMFTGQAVDPAMDPQIFAALQSSFVNEPGTEGGILAPKPEPQFGSVKKSVPQPTPAQERSQ